MKTKVSILFLLLALVVPSSLFAAGNPDYTGDGCVGEDDVDVFSGYFQSKDPRADIDGKSGISMRDMAFLMTRWDDCSVNFQSLYPFAVGQKLTFQNYNKDGITPLLTYETDYIEVWEDKSHFTIHRIYGNTGQQKPPDCPRIDDVYIWSGENLYYTDTLNFFPPTGPNDKDALTHTLYYNSGHLWGTTAMKKGVEYSGSFSGKIYNIQQTNCQIISEQTRKQQTYQTTRKVSDATAWSPYTGGSAVTIPVLKVEQATYPSNDTYYSFKEEWYFYRDPIHGYIPIYTYGSYQKKKDASATYLWKTRLSTVEPL